MFFWVFVEGERNLGGVHAREDAGAREAMLHFFVVRMQGRGDVTFSAAPRHRSAVFLQPPRMHPSWNSSAEKVLHASTPLQQDALDDGGNTVRETDVPIAEEAESSVTLRNGSKKHIHGAVKGAWEPPGTRRRRSTLFIFLLHTLGYKAMVGLQQPPWCHHGDTMPTPRRYHADTMEAPWSHHGEFMEMVGSSWVHGGPVVGS